MIKLPEYDIGDTWILSHRSEKKSVEPAKPYLYFQEKELTISGKVEMVNTIFLTNSECPFKCLMCDLWQNTTDTPVGLGDIPKQIEWSISQLGPAKHIKLYNSGNFFDRKAIPVEDYEDIARILESYENVIVESHPKLIGDLCLHFNELLKGNLQVAIGLETTNPEVLPLLNKRMDLNDFQKAVQFLSSNGISSRAFILLRPPFLSEAEGVEWAKKSIEFAFGAGVDCCAVIPTRAGNGALEQLQNDGYYTPPNIISLEEVLEYGIGLKGGIMFGDLWDIHKFSACDKCLDSRTDRINEMNLTQLISNKVECDCTAV
jgi:radical SAM enzyme (TIGR01210 family)